MAPIDGVTLLGTAEIMSARVPRRIEPHRYLGYSGVPGFRDGPDRHNSFGFRGDEILLKKPKHMLRVVCIGGSTTYSSGIQSYKGSYPYKLQEYLRNSIGPNVEVVNAGLPGWGSWESAINLQFRVLDLEPDLIVYYDSINDVHPRLVWPPESYVGDNSGYRQVDQSSLGLRIARMSLAYRAVSVLLLKNEPSTLLDAQSKAATYWGDELTKQQMERAYPAGIFTKHNAAEMLATNGPIYFKRNLTSMVAIAKANNVLFVLSTFGFAPRSFPQEPRVASPEFRLALQEQNKLIRTLGLSENVPVADVWSAIPDEPKYWLDGRHVSEAGAALQAETIGLVLLPLLSRVER